MSLVQAIVCACWEVGDDSVGCQTAIVGSMAEGKTVEGADLFLNFIVAVVCIYTEVFWSGSGSFNGV